MSDGKEESGKRSFKKFTWEDRVRLETLLETNKMTVAEIARQMGFHRSTIYREIEKGTYKHTKEGYYYKEKKQYASDKGQALADKRKKKTGRKKKFDAVRDAKLVKHVKKYLKRHLYSPYAALMEAPKKSIEVTFSDRTLYRYIYAGMIEGLSAKDLPVGRYKARRKALKRTFRKKDMPQPAKSISERPKEVLTREEFGHWEMDTVMGPKGEANKTLLVLTERKWRYELVIILQRHTTAMVVAALETLKRKLGSDYSKVFKSIAMDNGSEFADAGGIAEMSESEAAAALYYCHPHASWERGSNEAANRFIRRFIPKGYNFDHMTQEDIAGIQIWMNDYPRKIFSGKCAYDMVLVELEAMGLSEDKMDAVLAAATEDVRLDDTEAAA